MTTTLDIVPVHNGQIARRVGQFHVATGPLTLVREVKQLMVGDKWRKTWTPTHRRYFIAAVLNAHAINQQLYIDVMKRRLVELEWCYMFNAEGTTPKEKVIA